MATARKKKVTKKTAKKVVRRKASSSSQKKKRGGGGRGAPFEPTSEQRRLVEFMVGHGIKIVEIATMITNPLTGKSISVDTLQKHFRREMDAGKPKIEVALANALYKKAISPDHPQAAVAAMFMLKCKFGWRQADKILHQHQMDVKSGVLVAPAGVTPEEWIEKSKKANAKKKAPVLLKKASGN